MVGFETGSVSSSVMHASSYTEGVCTMVLHRTGSARALKISVGGYDGISSMITIFPVLRSSASHVSGGEVFQYCKPFGRIGQLLERTRGRPSTRSATISRMISEEPP